MKRLLLNLVAAAITVAAAERVHAQIQAPEIPTICCEAGLTGAKCCGVHSCSANLFTCYSN